MQARERLRSLATCVLLVQCLECDVFRFDQNRRRKNLPLHDLRYFMACGFARPVFGVLLLGAAIPFLPSRTYAIAWFIGVLAILVVGEWHAGYRARQQVTSWCSRHGFSAPRWKRRGGFVSWGCSVWSHCEILTCDFDDNSGVTHDVLVDVCAPVFGFWVKSRVLANVDTVFSPVAPES